MRLFSLGGKRSSGRFVITTRKGRWFLNTKPINWAKVLGYGIVICFIVAVMVALIAETAAGTPSSETASEEPIIEPVIESISTNSSETTTSKPTTEAVSYMTSSQEEDTETRGQHRPEKMFLSSDIEAELISAKYQRAEKWQAKENTEEKAATEVIHTEEPQVYIPVTHGEVSYERVVSVGDYPEDVSTENLIRFCMDILINDYGMSDISAAAIVGGACLPESQLKTNAQLGQSYYGICQWNSNWFFQYIVPCMEENGYTMLSLEGQIRAIVECTNKGCMTKQRWEEFLSFDKEEQLNQAVELFTVFYEGCIGGSDPTEYYAKGTNYQLLNLRKSEAREALKVWYGGDYTGEKPYYP